MKILVLGDSASAGQATGGRGFPHVFREHLVADSAEPVEFEHTMLLLTGNGAPAYARKLVAEHDPDLVMLVIGPYLFTSGFVWLRVKRLFGDRAGRWFRSLEQGFDASTNKPGRVRPKINAAIRSLSRRVIGTETMTTWEESVRAGEETLRELARSEALDVLVVAHPKLGGWLEDERQSDDRQKHRDALRAEAERHHYLFVDGTDAFPGGADFVRAAPNDRLHGTTERHDAVGRHIYEQYRAHIGARDAETTS